MKQHERKENSEKTAKSLKKKQKTTQQLDFSDVLLHHSGAAAAAKEGTEKTKSMKPKAELFGVVGFRARLWLFGYKNAKNKTPVVENKDNIDWILDDLAFNKNTCL